MSLYSHLIKDLGYEKAIISRFALSAPKKYKVYQIPKRTSGTRLIAHPSKALKKYQYSIINYLSKIIQLHPCATAYVRNKGIKVNALQHKDSKYLLKMDFQNFFHSLTPQLLNEAFERKGTDLEQPELYLLRNLLFWAPNKASIGKVVLSIGAPSSPLISNFIMHPFDEEIYNICKAQNIIYTRYADDITFSTNQKEVLFEIPSIVKKLSFIHI